MPKGKNKGKGKTGSSTGKNKCKNDKIEENKGKVIKIKGMPEQDCTNISTKYGIRSKSRVDCVADCSRTKNESKKENVVSEKTKVEHGLDDNGTGTKKKEGGVSGSKIFLNSGLKKTGDGKPKVECEQESIGICGKNGIQMKEGGIRGHKSKVELGQTSIGISEIKLNEDRLKGKNTKRVFGRVSIGITGHNEIQIEVDGVRGKNIMVEFAKNSAGMCTQKRIAKSEDGAGGYKTKVKHGQESTGFNTRSGIEKKDEACGNNTKFGLDSTGMCTKTGIERKYDGEREKKTKVKFEQDCTGIYTKHGLKNKVNEARGNKTKVDFRQDSARTFTKNEKTIEKVRDNIKFGRDSSGVKWKEVLNSYKPSIEFGEGCSKIAYLFLHGKEPEIKAKETKFELEPECSGSINNEVKKKSQSEILNTEEDEFGLFDPILTSGEAFNLDVMGYDFDVKVQQYFEKKVEPKRFLFERSLPDASEEAGSSQIDVLEHDRQPTEIVSNNISAESAQ